MNDLDTARQILDSLPERFRANRVHNWKAVFHFDFVGADALKKTVSIGDGTCQIDEGWFQTADCVVQISPEDYVKIETGSLNPQMALLSGRLKVSDLESMIKFSRAFYPWRHPQSPSEQDSKGPVRSRSSGPLNGVRILDFSRLLPGPLASQMLAEMGAEVWKIEHPDRPDYVREYPPMLEGGSAFYHALNRSKHSLVVPYDEQEFQEVIHRLVKEADVLVEQFRPGAMKRWGLDFESLKKLNPRLVYVSLTGYGQHGPYHDRAGHDLNYLALSGILSVNRDQTGRPVIPGIQLADVGAGAYQVVNLALAGLYAAEKTGIGGWMDANMLQGLLPMLSLTYTSAYFSHSEQQPDGKGLLSGAVPNYQVYETADGKWMALGALELKFWKAFCESVGHEEWVEGIVPERGQAMGLQAQMVRLFKTKPQSEWTTLGKTHDICLTPVLEIGDLAHDGHIADQGWMIGPDIQTPGSWNGYPFQARWKAPTWNEDSRHVLESLGVDQEVIDACLQRAFRNR
ncbi:CoA transferase [Pontibacter sp. G13]|uniref:CoA transferase n=1 Tax=Pontibacter sp. G13 TaxID=3074898 RepID=UPI00288A07D5|nr:CoA transferase [Pontibacter sp. G13]WNJ18893.1 CoA transferase [Pontibacter sp. G13]